MLTGRGLNDSFPQIKDLGISLTPPSVFLPYRPHSALRMELHRLSENEQAFVECFSRFVNGQMGSAAKVGNALADDHRYLINEKGKVVFAFLERLANDYQKGRYDQRDEWVCRLAAEAIEHLVENRMYYRTLNND